MLNLTIMVIRGFGQAFGVLLNTPLYWSDGVTLHVYDIVIYVLLIFLFIKLFAVVTNNSVINKKQ